MSYSHDPHERAVEISDRWDRWHSRGYSFNPENAYVELARAYLELEVRFGFVQKELDVLKTRWEAIR